MDNDNKEFDPSLEFDAFTAGIEEGGLRSSSTIALIVCYIIANSKDKITSKTIIDALVEGKIANYFEVSDAIARMIKNNKITQDDDGYLGISEKSRFSVEIVENDLPITIREKSIELVMKVAKREIYKKENKVRIEQEENGFKVILHVSDVDNDFMKLSLYVPSKAQAQMIKEKFLQSPEKIYENLINSLF